MDIVRAIVQRHIVDCHRLFLLTGNPAHVWEGYRAHRDMCRNLRCDDPPPPWILEALDGLAGTGVSKRQRGKAETDWQIVERLKTISALREAHPERSLDSIFYQVAREEGISFERTRDLWYGYLAKKRNPQ